MLLWYFYPTLKFMINNKKQETLSWTGTRPFLHDTLGAEDSMRSHKPYNSGKLFDFEIRPKVQAFYAFQVSSRSIALKTALALPAVCCSLSLCSEFHAFNHVSFVGHLRCVRHCRAISARELRRMSRRLGACLRSKYIPVYRPRANISQRNRVVFRL